MSMRKILPVLLLALASAHPCQALEARANRVIDGDTLELTDGQKLRLIGVDTPELHNPKRNGRTAERTKRDAKTINAFAQKAKVYVERYVFESDGAGPAPKILYNKPRLLRLEYDPVNAAAGHKDKYGRTLAYVYVEGPGDKDPGGMPLNARIIRDGYGFAYTRVPFKYLQEFRRLEKKAREDKKGLWG